MNRCEATDIPVDEYGNKEPEVRCSRPDGHEGSHRHVYVPRPQVHGQLAFALDESDPDSFAVIPFGALADELDTTDTKTEEW